MLSVRSASDWIVLEWKLCYFILLVKTKLQTTERACSFEQLPAQVNRMQIIVLRQVIDLSATATTIKGSHARYYGPMCFQFWHSTYFNKLYRNLMHLSMSRLTYPRLGSEWGFVWDLSPKLVPREGAFATQIAILGHIVSDSWDKQYKLVGDL